MKETLDLHIVILNYLMKDDVLVALDSLLADIKNAPYKIHITVADNSENKDNIKQSLPKNNKVSYFDTGGNVGFGKGNTLAMKTKEARFYLLLNPDTSFLKNTNTIERMLLFMEKNPDIGCIGPKLIHKDKKLQYSCYRFDLPSILVKPFKQINFDKYSKYIREKADYYLMKDFDHQKTQPVDWVLGAAMMVRKEVIDTIGYFDERYFMYMEDCDWCRTMWEHGFAVYYVHDIVIKHKHGRASAKVPGIFKALVTNKMARTHVISWLKYLWKWRHNHKYYAKIS